ncbi:MAG TPA: hypothetical protein VII72_07305 [Myxococcota bacterium]|jgi:hypothetical protein
MDLPRPVRLGLGTAALAGAAAPDDERLAALLHFAAEQLRGPDGLAHLDTAPQHGDAERRLARCFGRFPALRARFQVATGWGLRFHPTDFGVEDVSLGSLHRSVEASAVLLRGIDRLYLHTHPGATPERLRWLLRGGDGCLDRMRDLRKRRVHGISQLGLSLATRAGLELVVGSPDLLAGFDALQLGASLVAGSPELAAQLQALAIPLVVCPPLGEEALGALPEALALTGSHDLAQLVQELGRASARAAPRPLELVYACEADPAAEPRAVEAALARHLSTRAPDPPAGAGGREADPARTAERIARALIGTRKSRLGSAPTGRALAELRRRIADHVAQGLPVDVILTWGPRKFHASRDDNRVDLAELAALARLAAFQAEVRELHPPGLRYTLFYEDLEGAFIEGEEEAAFWPYGAGLVRLVNALGFAAGLRVIGTRGLLRRFDPAEVDARLAENHAHLRAHWHGAGDGEALARLGFSGGIDPESRRFYLERLDRLLGERRTRDEKRDMVIRLFAAVLLHRQLDMFRVRPGLDPVKLSFLSLAGGPASLADGRVDVRSISADLCKHSLAPWSAKGYLRRRLGAIQPASKPWPEPLPTGARLLRGELRLRRGGASALLRADRLETGP